VEKIPENLCKVSENMGKNGALKTEVNVREVLEVYITSLALTSSYFSKGATQIGKFELCPYGCHDRCIYMAPCIFQLFVLPVFC